MTRNPNAPFPIRWPARRLAIDGTSMVPCLLPGDRVVAVRLRVRPGDVVAVRDPRSPARIIVKRAVSIEDRRVLVAGDNPAASTDSRDFGPVERALVVGRVVYRYAPAARAGRITRSARSRR